MATYPTFADTPSRNSRERLLDDLQVDRATNGTPKVRALYTTPKKAFTVVHEQASAAEKATLDAFYSANRLLPITFVWAADGLTYTCLFASPPVPELAAALRWTITVDLIQA